MRVLFLSNAYCRDVDNSLARPGRKQANVLSEWREFHSAHCFAGKKKLDDSSHLDVEIARPCHAYEFVSFLVGLSTYQHPGI